MTTLERWQAKFTKLEATCPWPGPRPLRKGERLVGREEDTRLFTDKVLEHQLVELIGESGVGKSSLLNTALVEALEAEGFRPFVCRKWTRPSGETPDLDGLIRSQIPEHLDNDGGPVCAELDARFGGSAVLILDQFEELIRYQPDLFDKAVDWILEANQRNGTHIVLSLRSEYSHRLIEIERHVRPFSMAVHALEPLTAPEAIKSIISDPRSGMGKAITAEATGLLLEQWQAAQARSSVGWNETGLLQLQGTLYALHANVQAALAPSDDVVVDVPHVQGLMKQAVATETPEGRPLTVFQAGIRESVRIKLERCRATARSVGLPRTLVDGTNAIVQRLTPHLSSGGYKLEREELDLVRLAFARELDRLTGSGDPDHERPERDAIERVFRNLSDRSRPDPNAAAGDGAPKNRGRRVDKEDLLTVARSEVAAAAQLTLPETSPSARLRSNGVDVAPWDADRDNVSSGPLLGMPAAIVLIEELRRIVFAMRWLETAQLVRATSPTPGQTMLSLVHDGFASALEHWAEATHSGPEGALFLLTAARGETYDWRQSDDPDRPLREFDGSTLLHLRWRDCEISASFRDVVFVNCDFRGTRFRKCRFRGVVFVNCLLDGAAFEECAFLGATSDQPRIVDTPRRARKGLLIDEKLLPAFSVDITADAMSELRWYRQLPAKGGSNRILYSRTSGVAAVPQQKRYGTVLPSRRETGGLTMYGGRLSSLMIRHCTFEEEGSIALRHIAGSSLDIVEQVGGGTIHIADSAIRGLTITSSVEEVKHADGQQRLEVDVFNSFMTNVWFGNGLRGRAIFEECRLWQVCNVSDQQSLEVVVRASPYYGLVNVSTPDADSPAMPADFGAKAGGRDQLLLELMNMDYRSVPGRLELTKRS